MREGIDLLAVTPLSRRAIPGTPLGSMKSALTTASSTERGRAIEHALVSLLSAPGQTVEGSIGRLGGTPDGNRFGEFSQRLVELLSVDGIVKACSTRARAFQSVMASHQ